VFRLIAPSNKRATSPPPPPPSLPTHSLAPQSPSPPSEDRTPRKVSERRRGVVGVEVNTLVGVKENTLVGVEENTFSPANTSFPNTSFAPTVTSFRAMCVCVCVCVCVCISSTIPLSSSSTPPPLPPPPPPPPPLMTQWLGASSSRGGGGSGLRRMPRRIAPVCVIRLCLSGFRASVYRVLGIGCRVCEGSGIVRV
jgi:hypothetical protein